MRRRAIRKALLGAGLWAGLGAAPPALAETRALVVGIDDYRWVTRLHGAVNDARDISGALAARGVRDLAVLLDTAATRAGVTAALDGLVARARAGDLVIVSFAGHGSSETWGPQHPADVRTGDPYEVFLFRDFAPPTGSGHLPPDARRGFGERILGREMRAVFERLERKGARTVFVADACHGGGLTRESRVGAAAKTYRSIAYPTPPADDDPLPQQAAAQPAAGFDHLRAMPSLTFLAAVNSTMRSPEVDIPKGTTTKRGALSYAFARMLEGSGDSDRDGTLSREEMFAFVRTTVREFADFQQTPELQPSADGPDVRARKVIDLRQDLANVPPPQKPAVPRAVRVFVEGQPRSLAVRARTGDVTITATAARPEADLIWDPARGSVLSKAGDLVAADVTEAGLGAIAEREVALRELLALSQIRPPTEFRLADGDRLYCAEDRVTGVAGTVRDGVDNYVLFNVAGDGTVQFLGPQPERRDAVTLASGQPLFATKVVPPFGSDTMVLVTGRAPLGPLIDGLRALDGERAPLEAVERIKRSSVGELHVTLQSLFTAARPGAGGPCTPR